MNCSMIFLELLNSLILTNLYFIRDFTCFVLKCVTFSGNTTLLVAMVTITKVITAEAITIMVRDAYLSTSISLSVPVYLSLSIILSFSPSLSLFFPCLSLSLSLPISVSHRMYGIVYIILQGPSLSTIIDPQSSST